MNDIPPKSSPPQPADCSVSDYLPAPYQCLAPNGIILAVNKPWTDLFQIDRENAISHPFTEFISPEDQATFTDALGRMSKERATPSLPLLLQLSPPDGRAFRAELEWRYASPDDAPQCIHCLVRDVTQREAEDKLLQKSEMLFRTMVEQLPAGAVYIDGISIFMNLEAEKLIGYTRDEIKTVDQWFATLYRRESDEARQALEESRQRGFTDTVVLPTIRKRGEARLIEYAGQPYQDNREIWLLTDVSMRVRAEEQLKQSEQKYRSLIDGLNVGICRFVLAPSPRFIQVNPALVSILGFDSSTTLLREGTPDVLFEEEEGNSFIESIHNSVALLSTEVQIVRNDNVPIWVSCKYQPHYSEDGSSILWVDGIIEDISARKEIELQLQQSEDNYRTVFNTAADLIITVDADGNILDCNDRIKSFLQYEKHELINESVASIIYPDDLKKIVRNLSRTLKLGVAYRQECKMLRKDGDIISVQIDSSTVRKHDKRDLQTVWLIEDITDLKRAEAETELARKQLIQAEKMASLGTLVAGIAHEINNPNNFISMNTPLLRNAWDNAMPILDKYYQENGDFSMGGIPFSQIRDLSEQLFQGILQGSERIKDIVHGLRTYARNDPGDMNQQVKLNEVVSDTLALLRNVVKHATQNLKVELAENLPEIQGNPQRIEQALVNILQNACLAMQNNKGIIKITTTFDQEKNEVILDVEDEGEGIPEDILPNITDPFFTTRQTEGHTGLGLSIAAGIINDHKGRLVINSQENIGTTVTLVFPVLH